MEHCTQRGFIGSWIARVGVIVVVWGAVLCPAHAESASSLRLKQVLQTLDQLPSGRALLSYAEKRLSIPLREQPELLFQLSSISHTDAELTREMDPRTGREVRKRQVKVLLRANQPNETLIFDLAHELTHASVPPAWDPYDPALTPAGYILAVIDGPGGEVEAVMMECRVAIELSQQLKQSPSARCQRYLSESGELRAELIRKDFYRVGKAYSQVVQELGPDSDRLTMLSDESETLLSSTGRQSYPVSLMKEYEELTRVACENSKRRMYLRTPAGNFDDGARSLVQKRCTVNTTQGLARVVDK